MLIATSWDGGKMPWVDAVTPEHAERIRELWAEDFDRFRYNRNFDQVREGKVFCVTSLL